MNKFTWPVFFLWPCKPHPKDNKYHTIFCGDIGIMHKWDIVEGRYHKIPMGRPQLKTSPNMKTVEIMIWLTRELPTTGKAVVTYSGFCVLKLLQETRKRGLYGSLLIKRGTIGLRRFIVMLLTSTSGQKILVIWNVEVVNRMRQSLMFFF